MTEAFLSYLWQYQLFNAPLISLHGEDISIQKPGHLNTDSGPDFFNARIKIGSTLWVGNVEIHIRSSDWYLHQHEEDPAYNNTILHVVFEHDREVKTEDGSLLSCLELKGKFDTNSLYKYEYLLHNKNWIPCSKQIHEISDFDWKNWMERLAVERLEKKSEFVDELLSSTQNNWEKAFFVSLAGYFGQKINKLPFQILARSIEPNILSKHKDQIHQLEALFFGQAGLLEEDTEEPYHQNLKREYNFLRKKYKLVAMPKHLWKYMRLRPAAFPDIRIAQLAELHYQNEFLFSRVLEANSLTDLQSLLEVSASSYWDSHYRFKVDSPKKVKKLGKTTQMGIVINTFIPFLFVYGRRKGEPKYEDLSLTLLGEIKPEQNKITRNFTDLGKKAATALESQAMIELYQNYCNYKKCLSCRVGAVILKSH